jgi:hypothetical protein
MPWEVIKGNSSVQDIPVYDKDDVLLTNLSSATEIKFQVKGSELEGISALIEKTDGDGIQVDIPSEGYLRITINPADTVDLDEREYFMALQIKWSATTIYETILKIDGVQTKTFKVKKGIIT